MSDNKIDDIVKQLSKLTVAESADLASALENAWNVSASVPVAGPASASSSSDDNAAAEVKTEFDVVLSAAGDKKINVIKVVREITSLGLKEAKELVEASPKAVKEGISKEEAEEIKKKLEEAGASVEVK